MMPKRIVEIRKEYVQYTLSYLTDDANCLHYKLSLEAACKDY